MLRRCGLAALAFVALHSVAFAQTPQFAWKGGQTLTYKVVQQTSVSEELKDEGAALQTTTRLDLVKRWKVVDVGPDGVANLQMTLVSLRMEVKPPRGGEAMLFDSANLPGSHADLRTEMAQYVGPVLTAIRVDSRGQLVAVTESKFGPASRLEADLPFKVVLPTEPFKAGLTWERKFAIKLDPPQGAGETHPAITKYSFKGVSQGSSVVGVSTALVTPPAAAGETIPLLALQPEGDVYFDATNGKLRAVRYRTVKDVTNHRGEGSKYSYQSTYAEDIVDGQ